MPDNIPSPDFYGDNLMMLQLAHQNAVNSYQTPSGGFTVLLADIDVVLTRAIMKYFWQTHQRPEETDTVLDAHRQELIATGKPPLIITPVPRVALYNFLKELTHSEHMVRTRCDVKGPSLMVQLERTPTFQHFYTFLIGRTEEEGGIVTLLKETPFE